jgi:hypothetical protein
MGNSVRLINRGEQFELVVGGARFEGERLMDKGPGSLYLEIFFTMPRSEGLSLPEICCFQISSFMHHGQNLNIPACDLVNDAVGVERKLPHAVVTDSWRHPADAGADHPRHRLYPRSPA